MCSPAVCPGGNERKFGGQLGAPGLSGSRLTMSFALTESCVSFCAGYRLDEKGTRDAFL